MQRAIGICAVTPLIALGTDVDELHAQPPAPSYEIVVVAGDSSPDGNGVFSSTMPPVLSDSGRAAFLADLVATMGGDGDDWGLFLGDGSALDVLAREGQALPDDSTLAEVLSDVIAVNALDQVAFAAGLADPNPLPAFRGVFRASELGILMLARDDDPAPEGAGEFSSFGFPALNELGAVAFRGVLTSPQPLGPIGIYFGDAGGLQKVVREGEAAGPAGEVVGGVTGGPFDPTVNGMGEVAFRAALDGTRCLLVWSGGVLEVAACEQDPAADGLGTLDHIGASVPQLSDAGQVLFDAQVDAAVADYTGLFVSQSGLLTELARTGESLVGTVATITGIQRFVQNDLGEVAFAAFMSDGDDALFFWDGANVVLAAREGMLLPDGRPLPRFASDTEELAINEAGQVAFTAGTVAGSDVRAIHVWRPSGAVLEAVQVTQPFLGSVVSAFGFAAKPGGDAPGSSNTAVGNEFSGFNDAGEVAFSFVLEDGRSGIAKASFVAPAALTDGLLILRYLFGLRGDALVAGAVAVDCTSCSAAEIEAAIESVLDELDADGDGSSQALTDGLLILRYLFGLRGAALVDGALSEDCVRCDADAVEQHIEANLGALEIDGN